MTDRLPPTNGRDAGERVPIELLHGIVAAVEATVGTALDRVAALDARQSPVAAFVDAIRVLLPLVGQATAVVASLPVTDEGIAAALEALDAQIGYLDATAHRHDVGQVAGHLAQLFEVEDGMFHAARLELPHRRRAFYADEKATRSGIAGSALVDQIHTWFSTESFLRMLGVQGAETVLREPEGAPPPSALEEIIAEAVRGFVGGLPGRLFGALGAAAAAAVHTEGASEVVELLHEISEPVLDLPLSPITDAVGHDEGGDPSANSERVVAGGAMRPSAHIDRGSLVTAFLNRCRQAVARFHTSVIARLPKLLASLEVIPPDGLDVIYQALEKQGDDLPMLVRHDLVLEWMKLVAGALGGRDERGRHLGGGTLESVSERPGALRIGLEVTTAMTDGPPDPDRWGAPTRVPLPLPSVTVTELAVSGVGGGVVKDLAEAKHPIATVALDRFVTIWQVGGDTGQALPLGEVYLSPRGEIDLGVADWRALAKLGGGTERKDAEAAVRMLLAYARATTRDVTSGDR